MTPEQYYTIDIIVLASMVLFALWTVMTTYLLRAVVGLAVTSAAVTVLMFMLGAPIAAVFELSVCAGLIPAIFLSAITVTRKQTELAMVVETKEQIKKFWFLPVLVILACIAMMQVHVPEISQMTGVPEADLKSVLNVKTVLWDKRHLDLLGQIIILLGGAFGVVVLLKGPKNA